MYKNKLNTDFSIPISNSPPSLDSKSNQKYPDPTFQAFK